MGILSIIPPILALILAFVLKDSIIAMFIAICLGAIMLHGVDFVTPLVNDFLLPGISGNLETILGIILLGVWLEFIKACGGYKGFSAWCSKHVTTAKKTLTSTFWFSILTSVSVYLGNLAVPPVMRLPAKQNKIAPVKIPIIITSTCGPLSSLIPVTMFILFFSACIVMSVDGYDGYSLYVQSIPFMFYPIISIIFGGLYAYGLIPDVGLLKKMVKEAEAEQADTVGEEIAEGNSMGGSDAVADIWALVIPIIALVVALAGYYVLTKSIAFNPASMIGVLVAAIYGLLKKHIKMRDISRILAEGLMSVSDILMLLFVAFAFGQMVTAIGFSAFICGALGDSLSAALTPVCLFLVACLLSYSTGSLSAAAFFVFPMGLPLALATGASIPLTIGACASGSHFGDLSSPLSNNIIMPSGAMGVNPVDTAKCLLPYRLAKLVICAILFLVIGFIMA